MKKSDMTYSKPGLNHNKNFFVWFFIWGITLFSCNKESAPDFIQTAGEKVTERRSLSFIHSVDLSNNIQLVIHHDSLLFLEVEGGKNLLNDVETSVSNGTLKIRNHNKWNFMRDYERSELTVHVHTPHLENILFEGGGTIKSGNTLGFPNLHIETEQGSSDIVLDLNCQQLEAILHTGVSNLYLSGTCQNAYFYSNGFSIVRAEMLECESAHVNNQSTGDFYVHANTNLLVELYTFSNTFYRGNPAITLFRNGTGNLFPLP